MFSRIPELYSPRRRGSCNRDLRDIEKGHMKIAAGIQPAGRDRARPRRRAAPVKTKQKDQEEK